MARGMEFHKEEDEREGMKDSQSLPIGAKSEWKGFSDDESSHKGVLGVCSCIRGDHWCKYNWGESLDNVLEWGRMLHEMH